MKSTQFGGNGSRSPLATARVLGGLALALAALALPAPVAGEASEGTWTERASMATSRAWGAAATGADGKIYVLGGMTYSSSEPTTVLDTVEVYTASTNSWAAGPRLPEPRLNVMATSDNYGRIWAIGGNSDEGRLNSVVVYDPNRPELGWQAKPPLLTRRSSGAAVADADGRIYVMGGFTSETKSMTNTMEVYDPATNAWSWGTPFVLPRQAPAAATDRDGLVYLIGGSGSNTVEVYDPRTRVWSPGPPMSIDRSGLGAARGADGRIYAIGGHSNEIGGFKGCRGESTNATLCTVEAYDPANPLAGWVAVAKMTYLREYLSAATDTSGRVYAIGGQGLRQTADPLTLMSPLATVEVYPDPAPTVPGPPRALTAASGPGVGQITLAWQPPESDGGSAITGYRVYRGTTSTDLAPVTTVPDTMYVDSGLANGKVYYYRVSALNAAGEGPPSDGASARAHPAPA